MMPIVDLDSNPVLNHLWQSTVFVAAVYCVTLALRKNSAATRYWLWLAASVKFLVPFSLLVSLGSYVEWRNPPAVPPAINVVVLQATRPFNAVNAPAEPQPAPRFPILPVVWASGTLLALGIWTRKARRLDGILKQARPITTLDSPIPVRVTSNLIEPGVVGIVRPVMLLPEGLMENLTPKQVAAIMAHEICHVRRRDNLTAALHMLVRALFWFHPLLHWLSARLIEERERACDEYVLRQGAAPETYAESILNVCKFYVGSPLPCAAGVTGADLKERVFRIMTNTAALKMTIARKLSVGFLASCAITLPLLTGALQTTSQAANDGVNFDVASIRVNKSGETNSWISPGSGGGLKVRNTTVLQLVMFAYNVREFQVEGGPAWLNSEKFDIDATSDDLAPPKTLEDWLANRKRVRNLLNQRFHLTVRQNKRDLPAYQLTTTKQGHKMSSSDEADLQNTQLRIGRGQLQATGIPIDMLAEGLSGVVGRTIVNQTGLPGNYTFGLQWTPESTPEATGSDDPRATQGSIFTALQEQLGLKLNSKRLPVEVVVIERLERPTEN